MAEKRRPKRRNPKAARLTAVCELENCPHCGERLSSVGNAAHSHKTVQTLTGTVYVVAYSRVCQNRECSAYGTHFHAAEHLKVSLPYSTYGLDVVAFVGVQRECEHRQFSEIQAQLNGRGVAINDTSVGRLYRLFTALLEGAWPQRRERVAQAAAQHGGVILMADGLSPDGAGPQLYVLWEVFSGTPIGGMLIDQADEPHLTDWLNGCRDRIGDLPVLALLSDKEKALVGAMSAVWPQAAHQLCQMHFMQNLSGPIHRVDQALRQTLRDHLGSLPPVPELEPEAAATQIEQPVPEQDTAGKKGALDTAPVETKVRESHLEHLLFPESVVTNIRGAAALLQHYYGYYRQAIRDVLNRSSRKPFQCGGLRGYDQLVGIDLHLQQRHRKHGPDAYLDQLHERVQNAVRSAASQADQVRQTHAFLTQVERYLAGVPRPGPEADQPTPGSQAVETELKRMFAEFAQQSQASPLSRRLNRKWRTMSKTWLPGILHCYDIPGLPRSNLELESVFGKLRRAQRRRSGRKETTPLRIFGPGQMVFLSLDDQDILPLLQSVSTETYWSQRRQQAEREEPRRWLTRLHQDPARALAHLDEQFYAVVKTLADAPDAAPVYTC